MGAIPGSTNPIQSASVLLGNPISVASLAQIGAALNQCLNFIFPVGSIVRSMLDEPGFQGQIGSDSTWVLADGRYVAGSAYATLLSANYIPDLRGIFTRGLNNGGSARGSRTGLGSNPDGSGYSVGQIESFKMYTHLHSLWGYGETLPSLTNVVGIQPFNPANSPLLVGYSAAYNGVQLASHGTGSEMAPTNVSVNHFIRIN